ncbi:MAG: hypothetical protein NZ740_05510 [Kiritimatiellae bacterium]|nr:hypothetical protein [Kiritimatiellia bacterium]MDW8458550.1 hypothetical protein [Verrucomicrobiota bacterium]
MPGVNEAIAREFFEAQGFLIRQPIKYLVTARPKQPNEEIDFLAIRPGSGIEAPPTGAKVMAVSDLTSVTRAVVSVRGWHTERLDPSKLSLAPELVNFTQEPAMRRARQWLGEGPITRILCISGLPSSPHLRQKTLQFLAEKGVDGILLFPLMLRTLIHLVERNKNYEKSDLFQTLRILKIYKLLADEQMELFPPRRVRRRPVNSGDSP